MTLPDSPEKFRALFLGSQFVPLRPGQTTIDYLVALLKGAPEEVALLARQSLAELFKEPQSLSDESGEAWQNALELARRGKIRECIEPLRVLVADRTLAYVQADYSDLHGRALETLNEVDDLFDPLRQWHIEVEYRDFAPLMFAFVRDRSRRDVPKLLAQVARLGFLREALRSIIARYPEEGFSILLEGARIIGASADLMILGQFLDALPRLNLSPSQESTARTTLGFRLPAADVLVDLAPSISNLVVYSLHRLGFNARPFSPGASLSSWILTSGMDSSYLEFEALGGVRSGSERIIGVFYEGDARPSPFSRAEIVVPSYIRSPSEVAAAIVDRALSIIAGRSALEQLNPGPPVTARTPRAPNLDTLEALSYAGR